MAHFEQYSPRSIQFVKVEEVDGWYIKVYKQSMHERYAALDTFDAVLKQLSAFIDIPGQSLRPVYEHAFLIVHEARDGISILLFWWTGGEMLNRSTWFATVDEPQKLLYQPENNRLVCVWELEIILHERLAWIKHILENSENPDFSGYRGNHL